MNRVLTVAFSAFLAACTGGGGSSSSSSSSSSGGGSSGGVASSSAAGPSSGATASSGGGQSSSTVQSCVEACGTGCPAPEYWVCGQDGNRYCTACFAACSGTTVVDCPDAGTPADGGTTPDAGSCVEQCGVGCPAPEYWVCGADGQRYCNACNAGCAGTTVVACTTGDGGVPPLPDAGTLPCEAAGGQCVAVVPNACPAGIMSGAWSCGGGLGTSCCMPTWLCPPVCMEAGSFSEGWYDTCSGELLCHARCAGEFPSCDAVGTRSEGWYTTGDGCGLSTHLIAWTDCTP